MVVGNFADVTRLVPPTNADRMVPAIYGTPSTRFPRHGYVTPLVHQSNFFVEWKKGTWQFAAGWSGAYGRSLMLANTYQANNDQLLDPALLASWRTNYIARNGTGNLGGDQVPNPFQPVNGPRIPFLGTLGNTTISLRETLLPFPLFGGMTVQRQTGFSDYNALQFSASHHFSKGLLFNAHYTWSRALEVANALAQNNLGGEGTASIAGDYLHVDQNRRLGSNDIPHRVVMNYVYELPFGKGQQFGANNRLLSTLAGDGKLVARGSFTRARLWF